MGVDDAGARRHGYAKRRFAGCVLVSDNESWVGIGRYGSTGVMTEWQGVVKNQLRLGGHDISAPKLICIDIQPYGSTQAPERADRRGRFPLSTRAGVADDSPVPAATAHDTALGGLNIGGFSDAVFNVVASFLSGDANRFVAEVESIEL